MQFAAALVEYLVIGVISLVWVAPLLSHYFGISQKPDEATTILLLPFLYVIGIYIDQISSLVVTNFKAHRRAADRAKSTPRAYGKTVPILVHSPELGQTVLALVARDRIARGTFLNAILAMPVPWLIQLKWRYGLSLTVVAGCVALISFLMWRRFDRLSFEFKQHALEEIRRLPSDTGVPKTTIERAS